jgi:hypothetical protein
MYADAEEDFFFVNLRMYASYKKGVYNTLVQQQSISMAISKNKTLLVNSTTTSIAICSYQDSFLSLV